MNPEIKQHSLEKSLRFNRPSIIVLCGPSACGKSTFAKTHFRPTQIISSDYARALVCDDERDQRFNSQAFDLVHFLVETRLMLNRLCVVDSTALTVQARKELLNLAKKCQVQTTLIVFNVPLQTCLERDSRREKPVGPTVVERQYQNFELSKDSIKQEGFDQIVELQGSEQDKVGIDVVFRPILRDQRVNGSAPSSFGRPGQRVIRRSNGDGASVSSAAKVPAPMEPVAALLRTPIAVAPTPPTPAVASKIAESPAPVASKLSASGDKVALASASMGASKNEE